MLSRFLKAPSVPSPYSSAARCFAFNSATTPPSKPPLDGQLAQYLSETLGIDSKLHTGIIKAMESMHGKSNVTVEHLQAFGPIGMKALAASVEQELAKKMKKEGKSRPSTRVLVKIPHHKTEFELKWKLGKSLLTLAKDNPELMSEYMEGTCGGNMSCCTCHVYLEQPEIQALLPPPEEAELDMLDLAYDPKDTSRLGCQVKLTPQLLEAVSNDLQIEVTIPAGVNNVWK